jgi:quinoprotein glucose dehydrogenase
MKVSNPVIFYIVFLVLITTTMACKTGVQDEEWRTASGANDGNRYSNGDEINIENVGSLELAWVYDTGDSIRKGSTIPTTPLMIRGVLYGVSPNQNLFAVNAVDGTELWVFKAPDSTARGSIRGISYWENEEGKEGRIFYSTGPKLYAVDVLTGAGIESFGKQGFIDLRENLDGPFENSSVAGNAAPIIYKNLLITGMRLSEGEDAAPGHIRAFDVLTGERKWIFHTIPHPGEFGYDTWEDKDAWKRVGAANNWAGMSLDEERGIVYVPLGSATPDFYGARRKGSNLFANSLLALDASTGKYIWHFQTVHHDLWDRDLSANPNLVRLQKDGKLIDAVAQISKQGYIYVFDRVSGEPVFPIDEVAFPPSDLPGEEAWPTQPIPRLPEPFARQSFGPDDISNRTPEIQKELLEEFYKYRNGSLFIPPSLQGSWLFPGFDGGGQWGGASVDPETEIMYISNSELPWRLQMIPNPALNNVRASTVKEQGMMIYSKSCASCHGTNREGLGAAYPALTHLKRDYKEQQVRQIIDNGRNMMPAFKSLLSDTDKTALITYLLDLEDKETISKPSTSRKQVNRDSVPEFVLNGYQRFMDRDGYPGIKPPWGTLNAVNLSTGKLLWKVPLGNFDELSEFGMENTGTEIYGGPVVTKGGIVFVAGTQDEKIRAFDKKTGKVVWEHKLPAAGFATPAVFVVNGKQYVVIAAGGGKLGMKSSNKYLAFSLPRRY